MKSRIQFWGVSTCIKNILVPLLRGRWKVNVLLTKLCDTVSLLSVILGANIMD